MTEEEKKLILDLSLNRISESEFVARFPVDPRADTKYVLELLSAALTNNSRDDVAYGMLLGFRFGFPVEIASVLCQLIEQDWHEEHENMASVLQKLKDPTTIDCLYHAAFSRFPYLDFDENRALAVKCIWALTAIGTDRAIEKLKLLAKSKDRIIRKNAQERLKSLEHHRRRS